MNFFEIFGFLHVVFYCGMGMFFLTDALIKGFKVKDKEEKEEKEPVISMGNFKDYLNKQ